MGFSFCGSFLVLSTFTAVVNKIAIILLHIYELAKEYAMFKKQQHTTVKIDKTANSTTVQRDNEESVR